MRSLPVYPSGDMPIAAMVKTTEAGKHEGKARRPREGVGCAMCAPLLASSMSEFVLMYILISDTKVYAGRAILGSFENGRAPASPLSKSGRSWKKTVT